MINTIEEIISRCDGDFQFLNNFNDLTNVKRLIAKISCNFDYDMNGYDKLKMQQHYFTGKYNVGIYTKKILTAEINEIYFLTDTIKNLSEYKNLRELFVQKHDYEPEIDELLTETLEFDEVLRDYNIHNDLNRYFLNNESMDSIGPSFTKVELIGLDNIGCNIKYHGSFYGDSINLDIVNNGQAYMKLSLLCSNLNLPFYKELLLDSYIHLGEKNYKMCTFIAYAAFESFINIVSGQEDSEERLLDKFKSLFKTKQVDNKNLNTYDSYTKLINFYKDEKLQEIRNNIAHGKSDNDYWKDDEGLQTAYKMFVFSSLVIMCYEKSIKDFKNIYKNICPIEND